MKTVLIVLTLFVSACNVNTLEYGPFGDAVCTPEQWDKAVKEAKDSIEVSKSENSRGTYAEWFLGAAVARNCERKNP